METEIQQQTESNGSKALARAETAEPDASHMLSPYSSNQAFETAQRMAKSLAASSIVPSQYHNNVANTLIAMELASRIGVSVLAIMQNLHIIQGKPSLSAQFLIATLNASGRFTPLRYEFAGEPGKDSWACRAKAKSREDGELCVGSWITWAMVNKEGWSKKNGSKWQTMPEQMFMYRAAAFWVRAFCPEISIGFQTAEEQHDIHGESAASATDLPSDLAPKGPQSLEAVLGMARDAKPAVIDENGDAVPPGDSAASEAAKMARTIDTEQQRMLDDVAPAPRAKAR